MDYPFNPNGSQAAIAGVCDETGAFSVSCRILKPTSTVPTHPRWTREDLPEEGMGLWLYQNAVDFIRREL
jgi:phosphoribosylformylglycinamidine synthase